MKLLIAVRRKLNSKIPFQFQCVNVDRKGQLSEPYELSLEDVSRSLADGEIIHRLIKTSCRWEIGPQVQADEKFENFPNF